MTNNNFQHIGKTLIIISIGCWLFALFSGTIHLSEKQFRQVVKPPQQEILFAEIALLLNKDLPPILFTTAVAQTIAKANADFDQQQAWDKKIYEPYALLLAQAGRQGWAAEHGWLMLLLTFGLSTLGGGFLLYANLPKHTALRYAGRYHNSLTNRGIRAGILATFLITFYVVLYFYPHYLVGWIALLNPLANAWHGQPASQWFFYGTLYTLIMTLMGWWMWLKFKGLPYQRLRTASVVFFQVIFAFLIPEIMAKLNAPPTDLKHFWPLDYSFFFDYRIQEKIQNGTFGMFLLAWGILGIVLLIPVLTYFFGKRWYCSWVCGCGGLAETLGDPFRQHSDNSIKAWKIERWLIHGILAFAILMTAGVLYTYATGSYMLLGIIPTETLKSWYGFAIGSVFSGVIGTGFYPIFGNRVWCRFGCPLAAYMGLVQRFKSRFRITTNGGQCISCGNCSTYCEQGIDVRAYAQRGEPVVRASCVGCGICSAVCPRGVLNLENLG